VTPPQSRDADQWRREAYRRALERVPERRTSFRTTYDEEIPPLYAPEAEYDAAVREAGYPGEPPYTRGVQATMYRGRLWTMRQYAGFGSAEESNRRYRYLLSHGQTGLSVAFDLPTQMGFDPDDARVQGEVGKVGVSVSNIGDMEELFEGIPLGEVSTSMTINATASILLALYVAVAKRHGVDLARLSGTVQNDILKEYIARGTYIFPPRPSLRIITDMFAWCARELPRWNVISISGYHIREAGADAVQEVAFTMANAAAYVRAAVDAGLTVDAFASQLSFFFAAHSTLLEEVAKFRAARRVWYRLMTERFGAKDPQSSMLRFHTQTMGSTLTAQQPLNNIVRTAIEALAAVAGGTQSLHTNAYDEALALPTEDSARIALRTQQIIAYESGVAATIDPFAGSYAVEVQTRDIERRVWEYLDRIEEMGGALAAIERGFPQQEIEDSAYRYQQEIERGERVVVGVNAYRTEDGARPTLLRVDERAGERQRSHLRELRSRRDAERVAALRADLGEMARGRDNLMPGIVACVEAGVTLGEICADLRAVFGTYQPPAWSDR
jgi:methylmalonyl-CoA mutase N-terminal domain/subunit